MILTYKYATLDKYFYIEIDKISEADISKRSRFWKFSSPHKVEDSYNKN